MMDYSQYQKQNKRVHQIGISSIVVSIIIGFFAFGFVEDLRFLNDITKTFQNNEFFDNYKNINKYYEKSDSIIELNDNFKLEPRTSKLSYSEQNSAKQKEKLYEENTSIHVNEKIKTGELDSTVFVLDVKGKTYEVTKKLAENAKMKLVLTPTDDNLKELDIRKIMFISGKTAIPLDDGIAKIEGKNIILDFSSPNSWMPDIILKGTLSEEILKDNDDIIGVIFEDQTFFLSEGDSIPTYVNLKGKLEIDTA